MGKRHRKQQLSFLNGGLPCHGGNGLGIHRDFVDAQHSGEEGRNRSVDLLVPPRGHVDGVRLDIGRSEGIGIHIPPTDEHVLQAQRHVNAASPVLSSHILDYVPNRSLARCITRVVLLLIVRQALVDHSQLSGTRQGRPVRNVLDLVAGHHDVAQVDSQGNNAEKSHHGDGYHYQNRTLFRVPLPLAVNLAFHKGNSLHSYFINVLALSS